MRYQQGFFSHHAGLQHLRHGSSKLIVCDPCNQCRGQGRVTRDKDSDGEESSRQGLMKARAYCSGTPTKGKPASSAWAFQEHDLYVVLHVNEHSFFERDGKNLYCVVPVSFTQAALGTEIKVPTLEGEHALKVPEGTQTGTNFKLKNKGVPVLNGHGRGDLFVEVKLQTPAKLTKRQRELMQELDTTLSVENKPVSRSLLNKVKEIFG